MDSTDLSVTGRPLNILMASRAVVAHGIGGMERHCRDLCSGLAQRGHSVTVLTSADPNGRVTDCVGSVETHFIAGSKPGVYSAEYHRRVIELATGMHARRAFDVMFAESGGLSELIIRIPRQKRAPCIPIMHGTNWTEIFSQFAVMGSKRRWWRLVRYLLPTHLSYLMADWRYLHRADALVAVSPYVARALRHQYWVRKPVQVIRNGVDLTRYAPSASRRQAVRAKLDIADNTVTFLCIGRFSADKSFHVALEAFCRLVGDRPNSRLLMVGDGPERERLERIARAWKQGGKVVFTGGIHQDCTPDYYAAADVLVIPSLRYEGLPYALVEGAAYGLALITTRRGGQGAEIAHGSNGLLFDPGSLKGCMEAMRVLMGDPAYASRLGQTAREMAQERYDIAKMIDAFERLACETASDA